MNHKVNLTLWVSLWNWWTSHPPKIVDKSVRERALTALYYIVDLHRNSRLESLFQWVETCKKDDQPGQWMYLHAKVGVYLFEAMEDDPRVVNLMERLPIPLPNPQGCCPPTPLIPDIGRTL